MSGSKEVKIIWAQTESHGVQRRVLLRKALTFLAECLEVKIQENGNAEVHCLKVSIQNLRCRQDGRHLAFKLKAKCFSVES